MNFKGMFQSWPSDLHLLPRGDTFALVIDRDEAPNRSSTFFSIVNICHWRVALCGEISRKGQFVLVAAEERGQKEERMHRCLLLIKLNFLFQHCCFFEEGRFSGQRILVAIKVACEVLLVVFP